MEDGLWDKNQMSYESNNSVLILVLVEDGLWARKIAFRDRENGS